MSKKTIFTFVFLLLLCRVTKSTHGKRQAAFARPMNVVLFLVDDLDRDTGETTDLSQTHPGKRDRLHGLLKQWRDDMGVLLPSHPNPQFKGNK